MMNHTSSNLFEEYMNIVENIENDLDDTEKSCIIKQLRDTHSDNQDVLRAQFEKKE